MKPTKKEIELNKKGLCIHCKKSLMPDIKRHQKETVYFKEEVERRIRGRGTCDKCFDKHLMDD
jgi:hypothetical protein